MCEALVTVSNENRMARSNDLEEVKMNGMNYAMENNLSQLIDYTA